MQELGNHFQASQAEDTLVPQPFVPSNGADAADAAMTDGASSSVDAGSCGVSTPLVLSRAVLQTGEIEAMIARTAPGQKILTEAERAASLDAALAARPAGDAWLFAYGSLIWNPTVHSVERRAVHVFGWHRAFCLTVCSGRGSPELPGLVLALDKGGECSGIAYRIEDAALRDELALLWRREMVSGSYQPAWVDIFDSTHRTRRIGSALAFTIDPTDERYAGRLPSHEVVKILATASGFLGSAADYLFRTCEGLHASGIPDSEMDMLAETVREALETAVSARSGDDDAGLSIRPRSESPP
jgi:cation transport protein ChaC